MEPGRYSPGFLLQYDSGIPSNTNRKPLPAKWYFFTRVNTVPLYPKLLQNEKNNKE
jgi:hypothetical protein